MPSASIQYRFDPEMMAYFSFSRGFKAGGFNGFAPTGVAGNPGAAEFGPEHVSAYELGLKSKLDDDRVLINVDLFRSNYTGLQVEANLYNPVTKLSNGAVENAATSRSQGVEIEGQWAATESLRLIASATYLESISTSIPNARPTVLQGYCATSYVLPYCSQYPQPVPPDSDLSGQPTSFAPKWSGVVTASYGTPLPGNYRFTTALSPYFSSRYNVDPALNALGAATGTSAYVRLDGRLTLTTPDGRGSIDLIGKNLTNRVIGSLLASNGLYQGSKEEPRNVAIQVRYKW
jgi:outer membrane receptor protein involved in Fe transport